MPLPPELPEQDNLPPNPENYSGSEAPGHDANDNPLCNSTPDTSESSQVVSDNRLCYPIIGSPEEYRSSIPIDGHSSSESHNTTNSETNATGGTPTSNGRTTAASIAI